MICTGITLQSPQSVAIVMPVFQKRPNIIIIYLFYFFI